MAEHRWIQTLFILILGFEFTGASYFIRDGDDVTFTSENMINDQKNCDRTTWIFSGAGNTAAVTLFEHGKIHQEAKFKSDRLNVTENCSLVIKKVTDEDVGHYSCRQFDKSGRQQGGDAVARLSVVTMTEHKDTDKMMLNCSVRTYGHCSYTVKLLYDGKDIKNKPPYVQMSQSSCSATVHFLDPQSKYQSNLSTCEVTDGNNKHQFLFNLQPPGDNTVTATTAKPELSATTSSTNTDSPKPGDFWWLYVIPALVLLALIVAVVLWKRSKGNKPQMKDKAVLNLRPTVSQSAAETSHDMTDPEDGVSYASVGFTKKSKTKALAQKRNEDDASDAVTYTTLKVSSNDPGILYDSIN